MRLLARVAALIIVLLAVVIYLAHTNQVVYQAVVKLHGHR